MQTIPRRLAVVFVCFFLSGFAGLLYQSVWMRLALARFGVNTSIVSTVLTVFMLGLALGTYVAGRWAERLESRLRFRGLELYAVAEALIAIGGLSVPLLFDVGRGALLSMGAADSARYTAASAALVSLALLPFCVAMGATFPTALAYVRRVTSSGSAFSFSFLYLANVAGALAGVLVTSFLLIELVGFMTTLRLGFALNVLIAVLALRSGRARGEAAIAATATASDGPIGNAATDATAPVLPASGIASASAAPAPANSWGAAQTAALFLTGFSSMGLEVVWTRIYPPHIGTFVYSFAGILATYLVATAAGSYIYRHFLRTRPRSSPWRWWHGLCLASMLPLLTATATFQMPSALRIILGLAPFCAILGILTPWILDEKAGNDPARVGRAYAMNLVGCVIGPLAAGFVLIPLLGTKVATLLLVAPLFVFALSAPVRAERRRWEQGLAVALALAAWLTSRAFEEQFPKAQVRYDHTATVVAAGSGFQKKLFVNGIGMTILTPITKMMVHFPLAHWERPTGEPPNGLVICMGMGTTLRSLASWEGRTTVVELVPSVPRFFSYYFDDGPALLAAAGDAIRIEVDDGRRFLDRSGDAFDLITVDPPPPTEAAGSSLLYSKEFYESAKRRLAPGGILQAWFPGGDKETTSAVTQALLESFPEVRAFVSVGGWGVHYLCSMTPLPRLMAPDLVGRMPERAVRDMMEWDSATHPVQYMQTMLVQEIDPRRLVRGRDQGGGVPITDDRPINEFFFVRRYLSGRPEMEGK